MSELNLYDIYNQVKNQSILIEFKGGLSQEILMQMGDLINEKVGVDKKIKKIFSVFIELAQNMMKYSAEREIINGKNMGVGLILFTEEEFCYYVYSGKLIENEKLKSVCLCLDNVNAATEEQLKIMYKEQIKKPLLPNQNGAGLGFIEIARKSKSKIEYRITKVDEKLSFIVMIVKIEKG